LGTEAVDTAEKVNRLALPTEFDTLPPWDGPQVGRLAPQGERSSSKTWTPAMAQLILVLLQLLSLSMLFIDAVESTITATLDGVVVEPLIAAVAVVAIGTE
jgi:hypothetical protein